MSNLDINPNPAMCRYLVQQTNLFQQDPIIIVDVGARDGFSAEWGVFGSGMRVFCFEPDASECDRLNQNAPPNITYIPTALGRERKNQDLYLANLSYSTGLYPSNMDFFTRLLNRDNAVTIGTENIWVETLNHVMAARGVTGINFMKLDAEGAELDILLGGTNLLNSHTLFGIATEIRFHPEINTSPPFWQMDQYLQALSFRIFDIRANPQSRRELPFPGTMDYFLPDGTRFYAYTEHGQIMDGDALYFRDPLIPANEEMRKHLKPLDLLKLACFYELYYHNDAAAEILVKFENQIKPLVDCDLLLDLLTPTLHNNKLRYSEYMKLYFDPNTSFSRHQSTVPPSVPEKLKQDTPTMDQIVLDGSERSAKTLVDMLATTMGRETKLRRELEQYVNSTSWRITKPLRALKEWFFHK